MAMVIYSHYCRSLIGQGGLEIPFKVTAEMHSSENN